MRKSGLKGSSPEKIREWRKRAKGLERRTRLRDVNPERKAKLQALQFGRQAELSRHLPCCATHPELYREDLKALHYWRKKRQSDPHHRKTTGAGGLDHHTVPLKRKIHNRLDSPWHSQASVEAEYGVDFTAVSERLRRFVASPDYFAWNKRWEKSE